MTNAELDNIEFMLKWALKEVHESLDALTEYRKARVKNSDAQEDRLDDMVDEVLDLSGCVSLAVAKLHPAQAHIAAWHSKQEERGRHRVEIGPVVRAMEGCDNGQ